MQFSDVLANGCLPLNALLKPFSLVGSFSSVVVEFVNGRLSERHMG